MPRHTLAGFAGASQLVPKDRPIDGKDVSPFLLGKSPKTGRESYMFFGVDGELMSIKWLYYKMIVRATQAHGMDAINSSIATIQLPMFFDLSSDPHENRNLWTTTLTMAWVMGPMLEEKRAHERSVREYPNIKPGEDFRGYPPKRAQ